MSHRVLSGVYDTFKIKRNILKALLLLCLSLLLSSCLEVKQSININKDGSGDARIEVAVQQEWASMVIPKLKSDIPKGWTIDEEKQKNGRQVIVISRNFKDISELNDTESQYSLSSERKGFLKKSYILEVKQLKSSDMPFPYEVTIKVPGSIDETDGTKVSSGEVKWTLQGLKKGKALSAKSSALAIPDFTALKESFNSLKESFNEVFNSVFYREAIVFLRDNNIWVMDSDGKDQRQLTREGGVKSFFSVSRDGKIVFNKPKVSLSRTSDGYVSLKVEDLNLYSLHIDTGVVESLTTDNTSRNGVISPDGTKIIYEKADWTDPDWGCCGKGVWLLDLTDKTQKEIAREIPILPEIRSRFPWFEGKEWYGDNFIWSKDGKIIALIRRYGKSWPYLSYLLYLNRENLLHIGRSFKDFGMGIQVRDINFKAERLLFDTYAEGQGDLYIYDVKTERYNLLQKDAARGKFSPDGTMICFYKDGDLWIMDVDGKNKKRIYNSVNLWSFTWSPNNRKIAFSTSKIGFNTSKPETEILMININGFKTKKLADNAELPKWTSIPRFTFISPGTAKIIIFTVMGLTGILLLFGMVLITRKAIKAVIPKKRVISKGIFCPQCGKENSPDASFCTGCGQSLK